MPYRAAVYRTVPYCSPCCIGSDARTPSLTRTRARDLTRPDTAGGSTTGSRHGEIGEKTRGPAGRRTVPIRTLLHLPHPSPPVVHHFSATRRPRALDSHLHSPLLLLTSTTPDHVCTRPDQPCIGASRRPTQHPAVVVPNPPPGQAPPPWLPPTDPTILLSSPTAASPAQPSPVQPSPAQPGAYPTAAVRHGTCEIVNLPRPAPNPPGLLCSASGQSGKIRCCQVTHLTSHTLRPHSHPTHLTRDDAVHGQDPPPQQCLSRFPS